MSNLYYVYIMTNQKNGVLYIGVTNDLIRRIWEHQQEIVEGFTKKYKAKRLVYYEETSDIVSAIMREKRIKRWNRSWKIRLIQSLNPAWEDLYQKIANS